MNGPESRLATQTEEVFIQYFKAFPTLKNFPGKHYEADEEAETPDIMVKCVVDKFVDHPTDAKQRLYKAEVEIKMRGNIGKITADGFDVACAVMEDLIDNIASYAAIILTLPAFQTFSMFSTIDEEGGNERDDDEKRRHACRKIWLLVQEKC